MFDPQTMGNVRLIRDKFYFKCQISMNSTSDNVKNWHGYHYYYEGILLVFYSFLPLF